MTRKERAQLYEGIAIAAQAVLLLFVVPVLLSAHDSMAFFSGCILAGGTAGWLAYFIHRLNKES